MQKSNQNEQIVTFSPHLPLFAFGNGNFPSLLPWVSWVLWHRCPILPLVTLLLLSWAKLSLQWSSSGALRAEFGPARQHFWAGIRAGDEPGGLLWELSSLAARADPQLLGEQNGAWETVPLASLWKWMAENEWFAKENNPQVDQVLEKSADCSREIIESVWMVT